MKNSVKLAAVISLACINMLDVVVYAVEGDSSESSVSSGELIMNPQKDTLETYLQEETTATSQSSSDESSTVENSETTQTSVPNIPEEEFEEVFYNGEWIKFPKQSDADNDSSGVGITEENQNVLGENFKSTGEGRSARAVTTIHAGDTTRPRKDFVDISSYQPNISVAQFEAMRKYGVTGVVVKLTEGTSYRNPYASQQVTNAKKAGLKVSTYHFSWFATKAQAEAEADYYAKFAKELGLGSDTIMVNDAENAVMNNGFATANSVYFALRMINTHKFSSVIHYSSLSWFTSGILDAKVLHEPSTWVAQFLYNPQGTDLRHSQTAGWQWSDGVYFPEIPGLEFDMNIDYKGYFTQKENTLLYRLYNPATSEHHYTLNIGERDNLTKYYGWNSEGVGWSTPTTGSPVYRLYDKRSGDHHFTLSTFEKDSLVRNHAWTYEGIGWYSSNTGKPVYRLYNPRLRIGQHHYTLNASERDNLVKNQGWVYEGIGFYAI